MIRWLKQYDIYIALEPLPWWWSKPHWSASRKFGFLNFGVGLIYVDLQWPTEAKGRIG